MTRVTIRGIVQTSIVSAFTIAVALIWKDIIIGVIEYFVPPNEALYYKVLVAILATIIAIFAIYATLKTESEAEQVIKKMKKNKRLRI